MKKEFQAGTDAQSSTAADNSTSASVEASPMLSAALSRMEGNKLIAVFMGAEYRSWKDNYKTRYRFNQAIGDTFAFPASKLKYHISWDWLMPVWKKLGNLMYEIRRQLSGEDYKRAEIITINVLKALQRAEIDSAFDWIVEGVKWYNLNTAAVGSR